MMLRGTETKRNEVNIEVSMAQLWLSIKNALLKKHGIKKDWYLGDDGWFREDDDCGHGSPIVNKVAEATPDQLTLLERLKALEEIGDFSNYETWRDA